MTPVDGLAVTPSIPLRDYLNKELPPLPDASHRGEDRAAPSIPLRDYLNKELPPLPDASHRGEDGADSTASTYLDKILLTNSPQACRVSSDELLQPTLPPPPPPPTPAASRLWHKDNQWSGYEPKSDKVLHPDPNFPSVYESPSSSSVYSQYEGGSDAQEAGIESRRATPPDSGDIYLKPSIYSKDRSSGNFSDAAVKDQSVSSFSNISPLKGNQEGSTKSLPRVSLDGPSLEEHLNVVRSRYQTGSATNPEPDLGGYNQVPNDAAPEWVRALPTVRDKSKRPERLNLDKIPLFEYARNSMDRGILQATSPSRSRHSASSRREATTQTPSSWTPRQKENFATSRQSLKSLFLSPWRGKNSEGTKEEDNPSGRFSRVMRRHRPESPPSTRPTIQISPEVLDSTETPTPSKQRLKRLIPLGLTVTIQIGNKHLRRAVSMAKHSLSIKTASERRRENWKRKIIVIGLTDQSSDGRVAEWV